MDTGVWCVDTQRWLSTGPDGLPAQDSRWDVWAAGPVLHQLVCPPELPLAHASDVAAYARQLFAHYHGAAARRWAVAPWQSGAVRGASALAGPHFEALQAALTTHTAQLHRLRPLWAAALEWAVQQQPALQGQAIAQVLLVEGAQLTWLRLERGRCVDLNTARLSSASWADVVGALHERTSEVAASTLVMGYGLADGVPPAPACASYRILGTLHAAGPPAAWLAGSRWRALRHRLPSAQFGWDTFARPPALAWAALACAVSVFATAAWQARAHWQARDAGRALLQASQTAALEGARLVAPRPARQTAQALAAQARLVESMHRPWGQWLAGIEAAAGPRTQWLELEHDAQAGPAWRLRGQAPDHAGALDVVTALAQQPGWRQARLTRLQASQTNLPPSFELEALGADNPVAPALASKASSARALTAARSTKDQP